MIRYFKKLFLEHPREAGETYLEHMICAMKFSLYFLIASMACFTHSVFPFAFKATASSIASQIVAENKNRRE